MMHGLTALRDMPQMDFSCIPVFNTSHARDGAQLPIYATDWSGRQVAYAASSLQNAYMPPLPPGPPPLTHLNAPTSLHTFTKPTFQCPEDLFYAFATHVVTNGFTGESRALGAHEVPTPFANLQKLVFYHTNTDETKYSTNQMQSNKLVKLHKLIKRL